jgi:hypothetical protein
MPMYPTGSHATSLIEFQRERIRCMEKRIIELEKENDSLKIGRSKPNPVSANAIGAMAKSDYICIH